MNLVISYGMTNCKMIRSRDVVFNEKVMYKDRNTQVSEPKELEYFGPNDVSENRVVELVIQNDEEQGMPLQVNRRKCVKACEDSR